MNRRGLLTAGVLTCAAAGVMRAEDVELGAWLVEEGHTYALSTQARGTAGDARIVLSLMQAATRLAPRSADAYRWQYEMASLLGEEDVALDALQRYLTVKGDDVTRQLEWMEIELSLRQTVEARMEVLETLASEEGPGGPIVKSDAHRRLAELLYGQGETGVADGHIQQALNHYPGNEAARQLRDSFHGGVPQELMGALDFLSIVRENPSVWENCVNLARELDCLGLREPARKWYEHALKLLVRDGVDDRVAAKVLMEKAHSYKSDDKLEEARQCCQQAIERDPGAGQARMLLADLCRSANESKGCSEELSWLREYYEEKSARFAERPDALTGAALSWYFGRVEGASERALVFAESSLKLAPNNPVVRSCAGYAFLAAGNAELAAELLSVPAEVDAQAAVGLAEALCELGRTEDGIVLLREVASNCATGEAYDQARALLKSLNQEPPAPPDVSKVSEALERFPRRQLEYCFKPGRSLRFRVDLVSPIVDPLSPWEFRIRLANRGQYDITLGPGMMVDPRVVLSFDLSGEVDAQFPDYTTVEVDERPVLRPGDVLDVTRRVDTGPLREFLVRTVQMEYEIRVQAVLSPVLSRQGRWVALPQGPAAFRFTFLRPGLVATESSLSRLIAASKSEDSRARMPAAQKLVALWAEHQANMSEPGRYPASEVSAEMLREAIQERWIDEDQGVRLRTLGGLRLVHLKSEDVGSLAGLLHHEDPLTRMMAVLLIADQQGANFLPVVTGMAVRDPDPVVRQLCGGFRDNWTSPGAGTR